MITRTLAATTALAAGALPVLGQIDPGRFQLEVRPVARTYTDNGDGTFTATDVTGPLTIDTRTSTGGGARRVRVEFRYRIIVTDSTTGSYVRNGTTYASAGLASTGMSIRLSEALGPGATILPAPVSGSQVVTAAGYLNPDPMIDPGAGYGVYSPWRTGPIRPGPTFYANNGTVASPTLIRNILPVSTGSPLQRSTAGAGTEPRRWPFYAVDLQFPANYSRTQILTLSVDREFTDAGTASPWLFFPQVSPVPQPRPIQGTGGWIGGSVTIIVAGSVPCQDPPAATVSLVNCRPLVNWPTVLGATGYDVLRRQRSPAGDDVTVATNTPGNGYLDASAVPGVTYSYAARARFNDPSVCPVGASLGPFGADISVPLAPPGPGRGSAVAGCNSVDVTWPPVPGATALEVRRSSTGSFANAVVVGWAVPQDGGWTLTSGSLSPGVRYTFWAVPFNGCAEGPPSPPLEAAPLDPLGAVTGLAASVGQCTGITASWNPVPGAVDYEVLLTPLGSPFVTSATTFTTTAGPTQAFSVRARNQCGYGPPAVVVGTVGATAESVFSGPPASRAADTGATVTLTAPLRPGASFTGLRWLKDGVPLVDGPRVTGSGSTSLTLSPVRVADAGEYAVRASAACYSATSAAGVVGVRLPCRSDFDENGGTDLFDLFAFLEAYFAGCP